ncbi:hypothetical protein OZY43_00545 [Lactobacillus sp. ESL0785]|uniref:hypothetical protein n=1 Tax=Lactobacillus sp. ESL0785 TaxID=2983232 RepID=UPI0023F7FF88|nr:hypothetical protein [Lactobacillus sp. ESL0785]WEV70960.1 hypothetical protein OZY43_00545 [Lactobacillus sp. ESL0785]
MRHNAIPLAIAASLFSASLLFVTNGNTKVYAAESNDSAAQTTAVVSNEKTASDTTNQSPATNKDNDSVSQKPEAANAATTDHTDATAPVANTGSDSNQVAAGDGDSASQPVTAGNGDSTSQPVTGDDGQTTQPEAPVDNATDNPDAAGNNEAGQTTPADSDEPADATKPGDNSTAIDGDKTKPTMSDLNTAIANLLIIANEINGIADAGESLLAEPINVLGYLATMILGIAGMIPVVGIAPLIADAVVVGANTLWHGFQYAWSTARRAIVLAPTVIASILGPIINGINALVCESDKENAQAATDANLSDPTAQINTDPSQTDATSGTGPSETDPSDPDPAEAKVNEANKQLIDSLASSAATLLSVGIDALTQVVTFIAHAITEVAVIAGEVGLGVLGAIPGVGIIPLVGDLLLVTAHSGLNLAQRVLDEVRRVIILGAGGIASSVAAPVVNKELGLN